MGNKRHLKYLVLIFALAAFLIELSVYSTKYASNNKLSKQDSLVNSVNNKESVYNDAIIYAPLKRPKKRFDLEAYKNAFINKVSNSNGDRGYFLFDIDGDKLPELWIVTGEYEVEYKLSVYKYDNDNKSLVRIYQSPAEHTFYLQGPNYVISYTAWMTDFEISKIVYEDGNINSHIIKRGQGIYPKSVDYEGNKVEPYYSDYPKRPEPDVKTYDFDNIKPIQRLNIHK